MINVLSPDSSPEEKAEFMNDMLVLVGQVKSHPEAKQWLLDLHSKRITEADYLQKLASLEVSG